MLYGIGILGFVFVFLIILALYIILQEDKKNIQQQIQQQITKEEADFENNQKINFSLEYIQWSFGTITIVHEDFLSLKKEIQQYIVWMDHVIHAIILCLLTNWHLLLEWAPWLAKTKTIALFAKMLGLDFVRIQFTPDMLPSDIIGLEIYNQHTWKFVTQLGPIVANIVLADEINRAAPKVQSALLEAMQERQITIAGVSHQLPQPFLVLATQNPIEQEGTYPLPEAQLDRFLCKVIVDYPSYEQEKQILDISDNFLSFPSPTPLSNFKKKLTDYQKRVSAVIVSDAMKEYIAQIVLITRKQNPYIRYGASPRASIALMALAKAIAFLAWRDYVIEADIQRSLLPVLRHRVILSYDTQVEGNNVDEVLLELFFQKKNLRFS